MENNKNNNMSKNNKNDGKKMSKKEGKKEEEEVQKVAFYKLFSFGDKLDTLLMIIGGVAAICNGVSQPLSIVFLSKVINSFGHLNVDTIVHDISKISLLYFYLAIYTGIACFLQVTCWMVTGERQAARIRTLYLKTILRQDITFFDTETSTGEIIGRMSGDTVLIQDAMGEKVGKFIQLMATVVGGFVIGFIRGWRLAVVVLACVPALVTAGGVMAMLLSKMASRTQIAYAHAGNIVDQTVSAIRTVASFTGEKDAIKKYDEKLRFAYKATATQGLASGIGLGALMLITTFTYAAAVWYGSKLILENGYTGAQVINVILSMMQSGNALGQTSPCLNAFASGQAAAYKMFEAIKRMPDIDASSNDGITKEDIAGNIELKDVFFRYPARPDVQIFTGFSLKIPGGMTAALVGQSGSGKSTVISLIERFYDPESGEVLIDGVDLKKYRLSWVRQKIGLVSQEPVLFTTTLKENIAYGKDGATDQEIRTAIQLANADKFIDKLPQGLDTMVGDRGSQLSGGQKQRIAIARAILKNPKILLLDEATSALDAESERVVQDALDRIMTNRTTVVVAHRLTTIKNADLIAVVHQGKIVEKGSHDELIRDSEGGYSQLVRLQEENKEKKAFDMDPIITSPVERTMSRRSSSSRHSVSSIVDSSEINGHEEERKTQKNNDGFKENEEENQRNVSMRRLAYLNKPEVPILLLGSFAASIHGFMFPLLGFMTSLVIQTFYEPPHELHEHSRKWVLVYIGLGVMSIFILPFQNFLFGVAGGKLIRRVRFLCFEKIVYQEAKWFDHPANSSGAVGARLSTDAANVKSLVGDQLALAMQNIATLAGGLVIAFASNWLLALVVLAVMPFVFIQGYFQGKFRKGLSADAKVMYEEASEVASDAVGSIRTVASFCAEEKVMELYSKKCEKPLKSGVRLGQISGLGFGISFFALYCVSAFVYYIGAVFIHHHKATFWDFFKVYFALSTTANGLSQGSSLSMDRSKAKDSAVSIFKILDCNPDIDSKSDEGETLESVNGDIELNHVSFRYPTRPDIQIFRDLSLSIPSKKTVALVGESGSGKSTVISLIERFYEPDKGRILLDGVELHKFKLSWLRQQMGLVSQEPILFNETIRSNIAYGKQGSDSTENEIVEAAKAANAHNFISSLPQGYDTSVGERGMQLSGGQKQRIAIARAILKNPRILLLDEATSALDAKSEQIVQEALDGVMVDRTTVVVAHRLTTIKNADMIAVVKNGVVAEKGKHDELMRIKDGAYASLVALHASVSS